MERLSSCYFCGVAVEAEVREYPAVVGDPGGLDLPPVDERPTVPLCTSCRSKLDRIVAGLGADGAGSTLGPADGEGATPRAADPPDAGGREAEESDDVDDGEEATTTGDGAADGDRDGGSSVGISSDAEIFGDAEPVPVDGGDENRPDPETGDGADRGGDAGDDENGPERSYTASQAAGGRSTSSHGETSGGTTGEGGDGSGDEGGADEGDRADEGDGTSDEGVPDGPGDGPNGGSGPAPRNEGAGVSGEVPREAYDKVVRLLQNREFPVEEGDILTVASNAYGLDRRDCEAALDRLVDQGVIDRDGERLYRV